MFRQSRRLFLGGVGAAVCVNPVLRLRDIYQLNTLYSKHSQPITLPCAKYVSINEDEVDHIRDRKDFRVGRFLFNRPCTRSGLYLMLELNRILTDSIINTMTYSGERITQEDLERAGLSNLGTIETYRAGFGWGANYYFSSVSFNRFSDYPPNCSVHQRLLCHVYYYDYLTLTRKSRVYPVVIIQRPGEDQPSLHIMDTKEPPPGWNNFRQAQHAQLSYISKLITEWTMMNKQVYGTGPVGPTGLCV